MGIRALGDLLLANRETLLEDAVDEVWYDLAVTLEAILARHAPSKGFR